MRQIIMLDSQISDGGVVTVRSAFWFPIAAGQETPIPNFVSVLKGIATPTAAEADALIAGTVLEEIREFTFPRSLTRASIQASLQAAWADRKAYRDALPASSQWYGRSWDGTTWS